MQRRRGVRCRILLLQDRAVAISDQPRAHGLSLFDVRERPELDAKQLVGGRLWGNECGILFFLQGVHQCLRIFLLADGGYLDEVSGGRQRRRRLTCIRGWAWGSSRRRSIGWGSGSRIG